MKKFPIIHPFIFALYPLVYLYLTNTNQIFWHDVAGLLFATALAVPVVWSIVNYWIKPIEKSALITSAFFLLFFSFEHPITVLRDRTHWDTLINLLETVAMQRTLIAMWVLLLGLIVFLTLRARSDFRLVTQFMNVVAVTLAAFMIFQTISLLWGGRAVLQQLKTGEYFKFDLGDSQLATSQKPAAAPDIYYIILDGFGRSDILNEIYGYDNSEFTDFLKQQGFYIADQSTSNYPMTVLSLSSSLNFSYLDRLNQEYPGLTNDLNPLMFLLIQNRVERFLQKQGYEMVVFDSGFPITDVLPADVRLGPSVSLNAYQNQVINLTPLRLLLVNTQYDLHRNRILYAFDHLADADHAAKPRFIFAHILIPHPPFVFQADGSPMPIEKDFSIDDTGAFVGQADYVKNYRAQVIFASQQIEKLVTRIKSQSGPAPIIIIQGDHGPGSQLDWYSLENTNVHERFSNLNAYYFPNGDYTRLYPEITPVNSFRVIFDQYFGANYPLLPDHNYFVMLAAPYQWIDVTESVHHPTKTK